jgi:hypothetical protein
MAVAIRRTASSLAVLEEAGQLRVPDRPLKPPLSWGLMSDSTRFFLASFPGVGRAIFSTPEAALEWCDRRAEAKYPGAVEWDEPEDNEGAGTGKTGQRWFRQVKKPGAENVPAIDLGSVVSLLLDAEIDI